MKLGPFIQNHGPSNTIGRIKKLVERVEPEDFLFCFAYATASGCAEFRRKLGNAFWDEHETAWLFGIDYGRTHPAALEFIAARNNTTVKIVNGADVVAASSFVPTEDFHMKACFARNITDHKYGMVIGSGNFSRSGLIGNTECGVLLTTDSEQEYTGRFRDIFEKAWALWEDADELDDVLDDYKDRWKSTALNFTSQETADTEQAEEKQAPHEFGDYKFFWIDVGYVTLNRGPDRPGNQFDLPRGVHKFFCFDAPEYMPVNSVIGDVTFVLGDETLIRSLRLGHNYMEKITLPIPEQYGFGAYDGTIIEFERVENGFWIRTFEPNDYLLAHGQDSDLIIYRMGSGRPYGFRGL